MVDGFPDRVRFEDSVGDVVRRMADRGGRIHAFGEMVALLWAGGHRDAAIRLEELWNELGKAHRFSLFCAYPMAGFSDGSTAQALSGVCNCHSRVIPGESYHAADSPHERLQAIVLLQQKAQSLEAEIEHRKEVEKALQARERELADFFENGTEGLHKVGPDGTILWANKADCSLLGYSIEEYIGHSVAEFHADADVIDDMLQRLQRGESLENFPARLRCKNGTFKHVLVNSNACFEDGKFAYTRCFTRDISHQWQVENALREADRRKDEFLATLAHELRNPLAPVKNALAILELDSSNPTVVEEARSIMQRQVRHLVRLVDDLLDVSRITRDKITLKKDRVEVASIVESAVETSRPLIDVGRHQLTTTLPHQPLFVNGDATRLAQAVSNLLNNSAKYTPPGGRIQITVEASGTEVAIRVKDNGIGICCDDLVHVFDMFRQVDRSLERSQGGLGIGLTLVRRLVELHGGNVNAQSEGLGKGSEFVIRLPLAQVLPRAKPGPHDTSATPTTKRRILVVDDNRDSCDTLARLLRLSGHEIQTAHDGLEAIETASIFKPDVILMDVGMPNLNGYDATSRIRESDWGKEIDIFALTGWGQAEDVQKAMTAGCTGHMVKPVDFDTLNRLLVAATTPPKSGQSLIKNQRKPR
jgi:PAS domain S-box-containing protein